MNDVPDAVVGPDEVVVEAAAADMTFLDTLLRSGGVATKVRCNRDTCRVAQ
ncbi:hypothetical protein ACIHDR_24800 [Nocardia sp. NPDC052278]|uniref:hypothetical protein n=1 Tax=unclassified Nocardia TaxID=2637762 RepID=UPI0036CC6181